MQSSVHTMLYVLILGTVRLPFSFRLSLTYKSKKKQKQKNTSITTKNNTLPISRGFVNVALGAEKQQPISKNFNAEEVHNNCVQTASFQKLWTEREHFEDNIQ